MKKIKLLIMLFFFSGVAHALTLSQLQTEIRLRVKDTSISRQRYSDTELTNLINEAQRDVINTTWATEKTYSFDTSVGTTYYAFPTDMIVITRVTSNNLLLPEATLIKLDADNPGVAWQTLTGSLLQYYYIDHSHASHFGIFPLPADTSSTSTIKLWYYDQSADLSSASDVPFDGHEHLQQYSDLLIFYPAYRIYTIEGDLDKAKYYRDEYESRLKIMNDKIAIKPNYNPSFSGPSNSR